VWLTRIAFPLNYQLMYLAAFGITLISLWHVRQTRSIYIEPVRDTRFTDNILPWRDRAFHRVIWLTVLTHIGFFMIFPFISLYLVDYRGANEEFVGLFVLIELVGGAFIATQLPRFAAQYGHFNMLPLGMVGLAISSLAIILAPSLPLTLFGSLLNGIFWTMVNVGLYGYYNEKLSPKNLTAYTVCYSQSVFGATFIGSLLSSQLFRLDLGIVAILLIGTVVRLLIGMGIGLAGWSQAFRGFWHTWSVALSNTPNWIERVHHRH
jgi:predicted MFS family arabinose efflux permease